MAEIQMSDNVGDKQVVVPDISCCQVTKAMCCKPRGENVFWVCCARPILVIFAVLAALGALYLYLKGAAAHPPLTPLQVKKIRRDLVAVSLVW